MTWKILPSIGAAKFLAPYKDTPLVCPSSMAAVSQTATYLSVVVVTVVVVALAEVAAVSELRLFLTDGVADTRTALAPTVVAADRACVVPETHNSTCIADENLTGKTGQL